MSATTVIEKGQNLKPVVVLEPISEDLTQIGRVFEKKVKTALKEDKTKEAVEQLQKLNEQLKKISPEHVRRRIDLIGKLPKPVRAVIPDPIERFLENLFGAPIEKVLDVIAENYETVGDAVKDIELYLLKAKDNLLLDIEEMKLFKEKLESFLEKADLKLNELKEELKQLEERKRELGKLEIEDKDVESEKLEIESLLFATSQEIQDLETIKQAIGQGIVSIHQIIDTNTALVYAIERTIRVSKITITVGIMIRQAIANQKKAIKGVQETQKFASNLLLDNAKALRKQTEEVKELYTSPVLALDKVQKAYEELAKAIDEFENIKEKGYQIAVQNISKLEAMNEQLEIKLKSLEEVEKRKALKEKEIAVLEN